MALFENYERRAPKIMETLAKYGISSIEECKEITLAKGIDVDKIIRETQPICFENAVWAYTVGTAIALKSGATKAADAAAAIGIGLQSFCIP
ncbi:MAG: GGGtGRT protein, partial [Clostridia bacterium]|nr:GGGtGRT protein [Clostridia bacterium]